MPSQQLLDGLQIREILSRHALINPGSHFQPVEDEGSMSSQGEGEETVTMQFRFRQRQLRGWINKPQFS